MGGLGIPTLAMIMPGAYMSSLITAAHNIQTHSPRLHKHLMKSIINHDQFTTIGLMEHHDWFDGSDERGEPVYLLPTSEREKGNEQRHPDREAAQRQPLRSHQTRSAQCKATPHPGGRYKCGAGRRTAPASEAPIGRGGVRIPMAAHTTEGSQVGATEHQLPRAPVRHSAETQDGLAPERQDAREQEV